MRKIPLVLAFVPFLLVSGPVRAGDEFEDGFKDELGRVAAHEAVAVGRGVLARILLGAPAVYAPPAPAYGYGYPPPAYAYPYPAYPVPVPVYVYPAPRYGYGGWGPRYGYHRHHHPHGGHHDCD
jgi:hypothetical protein